MIQIIFQKDQNNDIQHIAIAGHANSAEYGRDLVCAGVSAITNGMLNAIDKLFKDQCNFIILYNGSGTVQIEVLKQSSELQIALRTFYWQLAALTSQSKNYVSLKEVFVNV